MKPSAEILKAAEQGALTATEALAPAIGAVEQKLGFAAKVGEEGLNLLSVAGERSEKTIAAQAGEQRLLGRDDEFSVEHLARLLGRKVPEPYTGPKISAGIPLFLADGHLPEGVHVASWQELMDRFATNPRRVELSQGMLEMVHDLKDHGYTDIHLGGSLKSLKENPADFDLAYRTGDRGVYPLFKDLPLFRNRELMKLAYGGEGLPDFADFFQYQKNLARRIGIIKLDLDTIPDRQSNTSLGLDFMNRFGGRERFRSALGNTTTEQKFPSTYGRVAASSLVRKGTNERVDRFVDEVTRRLSGNEKPL